MKKHDFCCIIILTIILALMLSGCSSISLDGAKAASSAFIHARVKPYPKASNATLALQEYAIEYISAEKVGNSWLLVANLSALVDNETKQATVTLKVDSAGKVSQFNGQKV